MIVSEQLLHIQIFSNNKKQYKASQQKLTLSSILVSILADHAGDRYSIPHRGVMYSSYHRLCSSMTAAFELKAIKR